MPSRFDLFVSKLGLRKQAKPLPVLANRNDRLGRDGQPERRPKPDRNRGELPAPRRHGAS